MSNIYTQLVPGLTLIAKLLDEGLAELATITMNAVSGVPGMYVGTVVGPLPIANYYITILSVNSVVAGPTLVSWSGTEILPTNGNISYINGTKIAGGGVSNNPWRPA